jgi:hypothetical protein
MKRANVLAAAAAAMVLGTFALAQGTDKSEPKVMLPPAIQNEFDKLKEDEKALKAILDYNKSLLDAKIKEGKEEKK